MRRFGPGFIVAAAFIGPGTVTTASLAGARHGYRLLWCLIFAVFAAVVLQEMAGRLGLVARRGLAQALRESFSTPLLRASVVFIVVCAIVAGNAAFQTGNILGAAVGADLLTSGGLSWSVAGISAFSFVALWTGRYRTLERLLVALVLAMSGMFVLSMLLVGPDLGAIVRASLPPTLPPAAALTALALVGTTVVPYNLFLHSRSVMEKWPAGLPPGEALRASRIDTVAAIVGGGVVTFAVLCTASVAFRGLDSTSIGLPEMAAQLEPVAGGIARSLFACGLLAAGTTSAITAPLAAAYAASDAFAWNEGLEGRRTRFVWMLVLLAGSILALLGKKPVHVILFAQAANGLILPLIAVFLVVAGNQSRLMKGYRNRLWSNLAASFVVVIATFLGLVQRVKVAQAVFG